MQQMVKKMTLTRTILSKSRACIISVQTLCVVRLGKNKRKDYRWIRFLPFSMMIE